MLISLQIRNYALIRKLEIEFNSGFSIITGETGAGKSILLGALSLLLGKRADSTVLKDQDKKCYVEGMFDVSKYGYQTFFSENDLDYDDNLVIRREILPGGKSRAFINDSPVNLNILRDLGLQLVDIHSQHENLNLGDHAFQLTVLDTAASNLELLDSYRDRFNAWAELKRDFEELQEKAKKSQSDLDYINFQYKQLEEARLEPEEQENLEKELKMLDHAEDIKRNLNQAFYLLDEKENSALRILQQVFQAFNSISEVYPSSGELAQRISSVLIELQDIASESERTSEDVEIDPGRQQHVRERLDLIFSLLQKHSSRDIEGLITLRDELEGKIKDISSYDEQIAELRNQIADLEEELEKLSAELSENRHNYISGMEEEVGGLLRSLGIPNAVFMVKLSGLDNFNSTGKDQVEFLFSANKQVKPREISKVASGGELSRLMLSIKSLLTDSLELPTIIFDEVDSGVSGDIAEKVATIMRSMSKGKQVINITHLPQVASKGHFHYLVYKYDKEGDTRTDIKLLGDEERVIEVAKMLSGEELTDAAISNARELLN
jgi:DNA repair protein RecN (Recombination protein N)